MTWDEFKAAVDEKLAELGQDGSVDIWYIDISYPTLERIDIYGADDDDGMAVSCHS